MMKLGNVLLVGILAFCGWEIYTAIPVSSQPQKGIQQDQKDPVKAMEVMLTEFPSRSEFNGVEYRFSDVTYDVKKTDSLVNPMIGILSFNDSNGDMRLQCIFHWKGGHWLFSKLVNPENGVDFTYSGGGAEVMSGSGMRPFLEKYGWHDAIPDPSHR
jgi:hypothetical protein